MRLLPVALAIFHEIVGDKLNLWVQVREDDGIYQGLLEFPGGGIEAGETPLQAAIREVEEEVGIRIEAESGKYIGTYEIPVPGKTILLYVHLFPKTDKLNGKGEWLIVGKDDLSQPYLGKIPTPNHRIIDDLYRALF